VSIPVATYAVTAYAFGVVIGSPAIILLAARGNRRTLLLGLIVLFLVGNGLSALEPNIALLVLFRFVAGSVQGAFFGAGAVVAAYVYGPGRSGRAFATVMGAHDRHHRRLTVGHLRRPARGLAGRVLDRGRRRAARRCRLGHLAA
jgi:predicted MFS family arabinose efflux permease